MSPNIVCLFHDDCFDGLGAAWAVMQKFKDKEEVEFISVKHGDAPPNHLVGKIVYIVDFCYQLDTLTQIAAIADQLHLFDHHEGFKEIIEQFQDRIHALGWDKSKVEAVYDSSRSGAKLTWEMLMPEFPTPAIIDFISDRDLWRFECDETEYVMAGLGSYRMDLETWDRLFNWAPDFDNRAEIILKNGGQPIHPHFEAMNRLYDEGRVVLRKMQIDVDRILQQTTRTIELGGHQVPLANLPRMFASEGLSKLAKGQPFAVGYFDTAEFRIFSLRSNPETGINLIPIAQQYGGNGHANSAGFRVSRDHPLAQY